MSLSSVDLYVHDDATQNPPVEGVVVRVFDSTGTMFITQGTTDVDGHVGFSLAAPGTYQARFFKEKFSVQQPQLFTTLDQLPNNFAVIGHVYKPPEAVHPRLCCCSGFFKNPDNSAAVRHLIHIIPKFDPILFEGSAMLTELLKQATDEAGYAQFNLVRNGQYQVTVEGFEDEVRIITIPDLPSVNLPDLIFSVVELITFDPPGPYSIGVGAQNDVIVVPTVHTSDGRVLPGSALGDVQWSSSDISVLAVLASGANLTLRGMAPGLAQIQAVRVDTSIIRIPNTPIQGVPVDVTVS
jgi:hypothetical protein